MYRLMIYFLGTLQMALLGLSYLKILPYHPVDIFSSALALSGACLGINYVAAKIFGAYTNTESALITGLILSLIVGPLDPRDNILYLVSVAGLAILSKYILAINKRHVFNPAAVGIVMSALILGKGASWWVGSPEIIGLVAAGSFLILTKLRRFSLAFVFLTAYALPATMFGIDPFTIMLYTPILFFTSVMLIEPFTSPVNQRQQMMYAVFAGGLLLTLQMTLKTPYTLELSLIIANVFSYLLGKPIRVEMKLKKREKIAENTYAFHFAPAKRFDFDPGQYMAWTLPHKGADERGVRRFFTISSSPNEGEVVVSIKVPQSPSSFKQTLMHMEPSEKIIANDPVGEFVLPKDKSIPIAFIAGGIGVTPFVSMAKWIVETGEKRDIVLLYANSSEEEISYSDILTQAEKYGMKTIYLLSRRDGHIDQKMIRSKIPDWKKRTFYISGPQVMVAGTEKILKDIGAKKIKTDYFPGYNKEN